MTHEQTGIPELPLQLEVAALMEDWQHRPQPEHVATLVNRGLDDEVIRAVAPSGNLPAMSAVLADFEQTLPYVRRLIDYMAWTYADVPVFFLARDAELIYDAYRTAYPQNPAVLLPANREFLRSEDMQDMRKSQQFLAEQGLGQAFVKDPAKTGLLFDIGFRGSAGLGIWTKLSQLYNVPIEQLRSRLPIRLINTLGYPDLQERPGEKLVDFDGSDGQPPSGLLPRATAVIQASPIGETIPGEHSTITHRLAVALQLMPHFSSKFSKIVEENGVMNAVPADPVAELPNLDTVPGSRNSSLVHPVAALMLQQRMVRYVLSGAE